MDTQVEEIDFTNSKVNPLYVYGGSNGSKIGIEYNNNIYMLKFPSPITKTKDLSYSNGTISEYLSCKIFKSIGIPVQEVILGTYNINRKRKIVVACKDFTNENESLEEFAKLKNTIITDTPKNGYGTDLNEVLETIEEQNLIDKNKLLRLLLGYVCC